jgi:hypothetical protein
LLPFYISSLGDNFLSSAKGKYLILLSRTIVYPNSGCHIFVNLNVAKVGGLQSQGVKGDAAPPWRGREPLTTQDLKFSGFPDGPLPRGPKGQQHGKIDPIL